MSNGGQKRSEHRGRSERGAALVETAIILPLIILITFGMIEFSMAYRDASTVADSARAGARTGSAQARNANFAINAANAVGSVLQGDVPSDSPIEVWIYKANTNGYPGGGTDFSSCTTNCISYQWDASTKAFRTSSPGGSGWSAATQNVCSEPFDQIGVFVRINHQYMTTFFGSNVVLTDHSVFRFEPVPSATCS